MATPNYDIDKEAVKAGVDAEMNTALTENENLYGGMIEDSDAFYNSQIQATQDWADKQTEIQNEQTDFAIEKIEQQKDQANKDYLKEQSASYVDWQKQSNQYGANAEKMAASGLAGTGYSESSQVSMYNTYQNRVAAARQTYSQAVLNYDNAIKDARLQNNAALAQIAFESLQKQLELSLAGFQYKNTLLAQKATQKTTIEQNYYSRYLAELDQINKENSLKEDVRQYESSLAEQQRQFNKTFEAQYGKAADGDANGVKINSTHKTTSSNSTKNANNEKIQQKKSQQSESKKTQIKTKYYSGAIAEDVGGFGYMGKDENGVAYQPKGVMIDGKAYKLEKLAPAQILFGKDAVNSSGVSIVGQNVWMANGQTFIWNGTKNKYERVS